MNAENNLSNTLDRDDSEGETLRDEKSRYPVRNFRRGQILFHQSQLNENLYLIHQGIIKVHTQNESGKQIIHSLLSEGDLVGLSALMSGKASPYTASVIEEAKVCVLKRDEVLELMKTRQNFREVLFQRITEDQEQSYHRSGDLIHFKVRQRMAKRLFELGESFGENQGNTIRIKVRLSREELAAFIGIATETAIRFMSEFKQKNIITEDNRQIIIIDQENLKSMFSN